MARGKLTEEQAEAHPQRNVITRALGAEPDVEVDVEVFGARDGDVYLLCSDGLTGDDPRARASSAVLERMTSLEQTGRDLIAAANAAGGRDNITVILFRLEEVSAGGGGRRRRGGGRPPTTPTRAHDGVRHVRGRGRAAPRQGVSRPSAHTRVRDEEAMHAGEVAHAVRAADDARGGLPGQRHRGAVGHQAARGHPDGGCPAAHRPAPGRHAARGRPRGRARRTQAPPAHPAAGVIAPSCCWSMVGSAFWLATRAVYFVGADEDRGNVVTIYRGLPVDLPLGIEALQPLRAAPGVTLESVPPARRATFTNHKLRSKDDAENLVIQLERGQLDS